MQYQPCTDAEKSLLWEREKERMCCAAVICNKCGGSYAAKCACAYARWQPADNAVQVLRRKRTDPVTEAEKAQLWRYLLWGKKNKHDKAAACVNAACGNMPCDACPCAYKAFVPPQDEVFNLRWRGY